MNMENLTALMRNAIGEAQNLALSADHQRLAPEHLLLALIAEDGTIATTLIDRSGGIPAQLRDVLEKAIDSMPAVTGSGAGGLTLDPALARILAKADSMARDRGDDFVAADIVTLAMLRSGAPVAKLMQATGLDAGRLDAALDAQRAGRTVDTESSEDMFEALGKYATDLTDAARKGKLDPVIGRDAEVRRTIQISLAGQRTTLC